MKHLRTTHVHRTPRPRALLGLLAASALAMGAAACSNADPTQDPASGTQSGEDEGAAQSDDGAAVVIGSQAYYSNEIIAELFAQVLEHEGVTVQREYQIGQREVYMPELESGAIDIMPEYTGNLLQYYDASATSGSPEEIADQLNAALPEALTALPFAQASDQDSFVVTREFAQDNGLTSVADLAKVGGSVKIAANSEFEARPYGPQGLKDTYGVDVELVPVEDSGGPLTVKALLDGTVQVADIYSADPAISANHLVTLSDPESLVLPQNVVPIVSQRVDEGARAAIRTVTDALGTEELIELNARSVDEQASSADIASAWLTQKGLI